MREKKATRDKFFTFLDRAINPKSFSSPPEKQSRSGSYIEKKNRLYKSRNISVKRRNKSH